VVDEQPTAAHKSVVPYYLQTYVPLGRESRIVAQSSSQTFLAAIADPLGSAPERSVAERVASPERSVAERVASFLLL